MNLYTPKESCQISQPYLPDATLFDTNDVSVRHVTNPLCCLIAQTESFRSKITLITPVSDTNRMFIEAPFAIMKPLETKFLFIMPSVAKVVMSEVPKLRTTKLMQLLLIDEFLDPALTKAVFLNEESQARTFHIGFVSSRRKRRRSMRRDVFAHRLVLEVDAVLRSLPLLNCS